MLYDKDSIETDEKVNQHSVILPIYDYVELRAHDLIRLPMY